MGHESSVISSKYSVPSIIDDMSCLIDEVHAEIDDDCKHIEEINSPYSVKLMNSITELFKLQKVIGEGASGVVFLAQSKQTHDHHAIKQMLRCDTFNHISFNREIHVLTQLNHPNIIRFTGAYMSNKNYYITTEYGSGGTLLERVSKMKRFSEQDCVLLIKTLLETLQYIHSKNIVHRDIKLSNIVFDDSDCAHSKLKLIDFGHSEQITNLNKRDASVMGSLHYIPPESLRFRKKRELFAGDMWAVGIIAYILIEGTVPYKGKDVASVVKCIEKRALRWNDKIPISDSCKDFICALLKKDINKRLNVTEALKHPWIVNQATDHTNGVLTVVINFESKLQRVMVNAVLDGMDETDKKRILSHNGYANDNQLMNQIISGNVIYKQISQISDKSLNDMDIDKILSEIDAETAECSAPNVELISSVSLPTMDDTISVERFTEILQSSRKKYDIAAIVANVTDNGSAPITFRRIACYYQPMHSLCDFVQE